MKSNIGKALIFGFLAVMVVFVGVGALANRASAATIPIVTSSTPTAGPATGGTAVTITGSGFTSSTAVYFGTSTAASFTVASNTTIFATSSAGTGVVDMTVVNASGTSATSSGDRFTYIPVGAGPAAVNLLSIGTNNFAILSSAGITDTGSHSSSITGNIGSSPITAASIGVWCSEMDGTSTIYGVDAAYIGEGSGFTTCFAGDPGVPVVTPPDANKTLVDNAAGDMVTAYNAATGMTGPTATELGSGNISGMTLPPGLYKWSSDVNINSNLYLDGSASAVWVFQIAGNLNVAALGSLVSGVHVILEGGAQASNIFWQVGGGTGATVGTYATFNGTILSAKQVILQTGAVLNGRALAQTGVTLDANPVTAPGVASSSSTATSTPVVTAVSPISGSNTGGTAVIITGSGFTSSTAVYFGTSTAASFSIASDTIILATSSAGTGTVDVTVANASGTSATSSADQFTYEVAVSPPATVVYGGNSVSGGGGGGGGYYIPVTTGVTASSAVPSLPNTGIAPAISGELSTLQNELLTLLKEQLQVLVQKAQAQGISIPVNAASSALSAITENLMIGSTGADVRALQSFLIGQAKGSAAATLGAVGATGTFGSLTKAALAEYQSVVGIAPAQGYFGPRTKAYLQSAGF